MAMAMATSPGSSRAGYAALLVWGGVQPVNNAGIDMSPLLNNWWTNEHLPERLSIPGFQRARRFEGKHRETGQQQYLTLYEVDTLTTLTSAAYMEKLNDPTPGTKKCLPMLAKMNRAACRTLYSSVRPELRDCEGLVGKHLLMLEAAVKPLDHILSNATTNTVIWFDYMVGENKDLLSCRLFLEDEQATVAGNASQSYQDVKLMGGKGDGFVRLILILESTEELGYGEGLLKLVLTNAGGDWRLQGDQTYGLMCSLSRRLR